MKLKTALLLPKIIAGVVNVISRAAGPVMAAAEDKIVTADEAEAIVVAALGDEDLKIKVKGTDILDPDGQRGLVTFVSRTLANLANALRD